MTTARDDVTAAMTVLSRALDQTGDVLAHVREEHLALPTPCREWDVAHLVAHLVATPRTMLAMARGEEVDWSVEAPAVEQGWAQEFRTAAGDLIHFWHQRGEAADPGTMDWQTAELAVHTWDLVRATGQERALDAEVADRGLAFMSLALTPENRGKAFGEKVVVPAAAPVYDRLAGFAGRQVSATAEAG